VHLACTQPLSILRGRPGTGKTTTLRQIVESFDNAGLSGAIFAPTGKARKRADEVVNDPGKKPFKNAPECKTIHRGLEYSPTDGGFKFGPRKNLDYDYVILDEFSMAGLSIAKSLFSAINPKKTRVILCGDPNQLPSVDSGNVMHDLIMSRAIPDTNLNYLFRQGADSGIAYNAGRILNGEDLAKTDPKTGELFNDFYFVEKRDPELARDYIINCVSESIPENRNLKHADIQVLSPGKKSEVGTVALNDGLRDRINPGKGGGYRGLRVGDRVINRKNNYELEIVNGDVGTVISTGNHGLTINFGPGAGPEGDGLVELNADNAESVYLAYAFTVHSSQGSEFPVCVIPLFKAHYRLLFRNMLYTGATRPKQLTLLVGDPLALKLCIDTSVVDKRSTGLQGLLR
jgi:exodeoxyribonuclease V alpha subunit